jgi:ATP-binding cassette subfamily B protein
MLIRLLRSYLRPYHKAITAVCVLQLVQSLATLLLPTLNADIIDNGVITGDTHYILRTGAIMLGVSVVQITCAIGAVYFGARTAMALGRDVRYGVFHRVQAFSAREVGRFGTPSLITRTTNDVQQVQMLAVMTFTLLVSAPVMCVGGVILALNQDVPLSSLLLVAVPLLGIIVSLIISRMRPLFRQMQTRIDVINRVLREQISGVRVIRAFVRDPLERDRFGTANTELFDVSLGVGRLMALMFPSVMLILNVSTIAVLWFGGHLEHADRRADGLHQLPAPDPDVRHDGHLCVHNGPARGGVRRADHGGARHRARPAPAAQPRHRAGQPRVPRAAGRRVPLPRCGEAGAVRHQPGRPAR